MVTEAYNVFSHGGPNDHFYTKTYTVGDSADGDTVLKFQDELHYACVPGRISNSRIENGTISNVRFAGTYVGQVNTFFDEAAGVCMNVTLPGHPLETGAAALKVFSDGSLIKMTVVGFGTNASPTIAAMNNLIAPSVIFGSVANRVFADMHPAPILLPVP